VGLPRKALRTTAIGTVSAALLAGSATAAAPVALPAAPALTAQNGAATASPDVRFVDIEGDGGIVLKANVVTPADADGRRTYPVVLLPTSWG
jgi:hypothetical protein